MTHSQIPKRAGVKWRGNLSCNLNSKERSPITSVENSICRPGSPEGPGVRG